MLWMSVLNTVSSYGLDFYFNRHLGLRNWAIEVLYDTTGLSLGKVSNKREEDIVLVESEEDVNGESVQREMDRERRMHLVRTWVFGTAFAVGIVGLWGDKK
jgi:autophagy-related protein 33